MIDTLWILLCSCLVFIMQAGFMCLESGLTRSKNSINVAAKNLSDFGFSILLFWVVGYGLKSGASYHGWVGISDFFLSLDTSRIAALFLFQAMFCSTAITIVSGAVAERMKFSAYLLIVCLVSSLIYPIFAHWVWNVTETGTRMGLLGRLGFVDFAGSTAVHSIGGWTSLAALLIIGPRWGRFSTTESFQTNLSSNLQFSVLGMFLLWFGWLGFNAGSGLTLNEQVPLVMVNTVLSGCAGMLTAGALSLTENKVLQVEILINGSLAGLVAICAGCHAVDAPIAIIIGSTAAAVMLLIEKILQRWQIDDAVGAVAVHGGAGAWGTLAVGLFGQLDVLGTGLNRYAQIGVQLLGILIAFEWAFSITFILLYCLNKKFPLRVSLEQEKIGLNYSEHHAKTELYDLFDVMEKQAKTRDLSLRVPIQPFTEVGAVALRYNQVMAALEEATIRTEAIIKTAINGIITFSEENLQITMANPTAIEMFGYSLEEFKGMSVTQLVEWYSSGSPTEASLLSELLKTGRHQLIGCRKNGQTFILEAAVTQVQLKNYSFYTAIFQDISERRKAEAALKKSQKQLRNQNSELEKMIQELQQTQTQLIQAEKMSSLGQMVAGVAHEINNPVSFIYGNIRPAIEYTQDLLELIRLYQNHCLQPNSEIAEYLDEVDVEYIVSDFPKLLNSMKTGAERIRDIVKSLRNFSRLDESEVKAVNLHEGIDSTLLILQSRLKVKSDSSEIQVIKEYGNLPKVECYPGQLNQVFMNIINNAIDALEESKTKPAKIRILTQQLDENWVSIQIADNGPGISQEIQNKLFDPFFTTKPVGKGTGLGLSISYKIITDKHQGKIECRSLPQQGTEFIIQIPISITPETQPTINQSVNHVSSV
ncbi:MAG: ammonium transporter [Microcoleaceae cyanobacterium]